MVPLAEAGDGREDPRADLLLALSHGRGQDPPPPSPDPLHVFYLLSALTHLSQVGRR